MTAWTQWIAGAEQANFFAFVAALEERLAPRTLVGTHGNARDELLRFRHDPDLSSAAGEISAVAILPPARQEGGPPRIEITSTFLGLTGTVSPLPSYVAEEVALEDPETGDRRAFLDLFHHRLLSLLVRLRLKQQWSPNQGAASHGSWHRRLEALSGHDGAGEASRLSPLRLLPLAIGRNRGIGTLRLAVAELLRQAVPGAQLTLVPLTGGWTSLGADAGCRLGERNHQLGEDCCLGEQSLDFGSRITLRVGPVPREALPRFQVGGDLHEAIGAWVSRCSAWPIGFALELTVDGDEGVRLSDEGRLGGSHEEGPPVAHGNRGRCLGLGLGRGSVLASKRCTITHRVPAWRPTPGVPLTHDRA